jgi:hypothetical protein
MIIPIADLKRFKRFATALFGHSLVKRTTIINIYPQNEQCVLTASSQGSQIKLTIPYRHVANDLQTPVTLAPEVLDHLCKGNGFAAFSEVASTENGSRYSVTWQQGVVSRSVDLDHNSPPPLTEHQCERFTVDDNLMHALQQTMQVTDDSSVRYALYCVQLDGRDGTVSATDGQQMLRFAGFDFPWSDQAILIRKSKLFTLSDFVNLKQVSVGVSGDVLLLEAESWKLSLPIQLECRFPDLNRVVPEISEATNRIDMSVDDRRVLESCIGQLPGGDDPHQPVLVDLNGHVAFVGHTNDGLQPAATLELDRSIHIGPDRKFHASRVNLQRSAKLGADSLLVFQPGKPVLARSDKMQFVWMPLENVTTGPNPLSGQKILASTVSIKKLKAA